MNIWIPQIAAAVPLVVILAALLLLKKLKKRGVLITIKTNSFKINSKWSSKWVLWALSLHRQSQKTISFLKLTAVIKWLLKRSQLWYNQSYNLKFLSQRKRRTVKERHQAIRLTGLHKKTKSCWDLFKFTAMLRGIDFVSLWPTKPKLDALRDFWRLQGNKEKREKKALTRKLFRSQLQDTQAHNGLLLKMSFLNQKWTNLELKIGSLSPDSWQEDLGANVERGGTMFLTQKSLEESGQKRKIFSSSKCKRNLAPNGPKSPN